LGNAREHELVLKDKVAHHLSFRKGTSTQSYPSSLMGGIALIRQTYLDGQWYASNGKKEEFNISLEAWNKAKALPQFFEVRDRLDIFRANKIGKEFGLNYIIKGTGDEYMRIADIKKTGASLIIPVNYPKAYDVSDAYDAMQVSLTDMKHWELAPTNAAAIAKQNIPFAFTTKGLKDKKSFLGNIRKAIKHGLSEDAALAALTTTPARLAKVETMVGTLERGKMANFIVTDKPIFDEKAKIHQNWVGGQGFVLKPFKTEAPLGEGRYNFKVGKKRYVLDIIYNDEKPSFKIIENDSTKIDVKHSYNNQILGLSFREEGKLVRLSGTSKSSSASGKGNDVDDNWVTWSISPTRALPEREDKKEDDKGEGKSKEDKKDALGEITYPFLPYGWTNKPTAKTVLFKNATVWTNE
ncbi:MAG: amidohydrolase family protein, partial [Saprospiraceae bacterium]